MWPLSSSPTVWSEPRPFGVEVLVGRDAMEVLCDTSGAGGASLQSTAGSLDAMPAPDWLTAAWYRTEPAITPVAVVLTDVSSGRVVAPLGFRRRTGFVEVVVAGHPAVDLIRWASMGRQPEAVAAAVARVLAAAGPRAALRLEQVAADELWVRALARMLGRPLTAGQAVVVTRLGPDRDPAAVASANFRRKAKQVRRRLEAEGRLVEITSLHEFDAVAAMLPAVAALRKARDRATGRRTPFDGGPGSAALRAAIADAALAGRIELASVTVDGALAAYNLAVVEPSVYRVVDGRIGSTWSSTSLGRLADLASVTSACQRADVAWIDWGRGLGSHKERLATDLIETVDLTAWTSPIAGLLGPGARAARQRAQKAAAEYPRALATWHRAKGRLSRPRRVTVRPEPEEPR
jgi:CelD/BcsL family acetyltransferase involved in cellulose biosynthesis